jgi:hypothetical protein
MVSIRTDRFAWASNCAMDWAVRGSNLGESEIFHTRPDQPWGPSSHLYIECWVSFPARKAAGAWLSPSTSPSSAEVDEILELYLYSPSGPRLACSRMNFTLPTSLITRSVFWTDGGFVSIVWLAQNTATCSININSFVFVMEMQCAVVRQEMNY